MVEQKGIGYMIEVIIAMMTLLIFLTGSSYDVEPQNWNDFQAEIEARDLGNALKKTGHLSNFVKRSETGSIMTAFETISKNRYGVSGNIDNLPTGRKKIGFYTNSDEILSGPAGGISDCSGDLGELPSEYPVKSTEGSGKESSHGSIRIYFTDSDPKVPGTPGFNGQKDYDTLWVDNGTKCQFNASQGPYHEGQFFKWENSIYDFEKITENGEEFTFYEANQAYRFKKTFEKSVNTIPTDTKIDTINFSLQKLSDFDTIIFRSRDALSEIRLSNNEERLLDYLKSGSALFLMDLDQSHLNSGFFSRTNWNWVNTGLESSNTGTGFSDMDKSHKVRTIFRGISNEDPVISPGGKISSTRENYVTQQPLVYAEGLNYDENSWEMRNLSLDDVQESDLPPGVPDSDCGPGGNYRNGTFEKPSGISVEGITFELDCDDSIWGFALDKNNNGKIEESEKTFLNEDQIEVGKRKLTTILGGTGCKEGECVRLEYRGSQKVETVNYAEDLRNRNINRIARADYDPSYTEAERELLTAVIYWLSGDTTFFGQDKEVIARTKVVSSIRADVYMPYILNLRWSRR